IEDILEEIVGEITDEYDQERPMVEWLGPGRARVNARLPVTDLEELFGVTIEAEDGETVGGLLAHALGRVPIAGSTATVAGLKLTPEDPARRRGGLGAVRVERARAAKTDRGRSRRAHDHDKKGQGPQPPRARRGAEVRERGSVLIAARTCVP